jgi:hypothetical protein
MALQSTTAIATITLQQATSAVTFSGIPNAYRDLVLIVQGRAVASGEKFFYVYFNGDTAANYSRVEMTGNPSSASFANLIPITLISSNEGRCHISIFDYSATNKHKSVLYRNDALNTTATPLAGAGRWASNTAIDTIRIEGFSGAQLASGTNISLYGRIA